MLAVASGLPNAMKLAGLIALSDPPRPDSTTLIAELHGLGVTTVMVTGDAPTTSAIVVSAVGLDGAVVRQDRCPTTFALNNSPSSQACCRKISISSFLIAGLLMTGHAILNPLLMVIVMIAVDFLAMSITTDNVRPSPIPNTWRIGNLTIAGIVLGVGQLAFCTGVLAASKFELNLGTQALQTLAFTVLVFGSQAPIYAIRERKRLWRSGPSVWLAVSSAVDIPIASILAIDGIAMSPLPLLVVAVTIAASAAFSLVLDLTKDSRICSSRDHLVRSSYRVATCAPARGSFYSSTPRLLNSIGVVTVGRCPT